MKEAQVYLLFNGTCREAMTLYAKALGAQVEMQTFDQAPIPDEYKAKGKIIHARLQRGATVLMASDCRPNDPITVGNHMSVSLQCESREEVDRLYKALGEGGKPLMPPADTFWNAYFAMMTDQFGVGWMLNFEKPKPPTAPGAMEGGG